MKSLLCATCLLLFFSCSDSVPVIPLQLQGFDGTITLVPPSGILKFSLNQPVSWRSSGGVVTQGANDTLTYTAPATAGMQQVVLRSQTNAQDSLLIGIAVTPSAALFSSLRGGNYILIFRHAAADVGTDQPASTTPDWWKSCDSKLARQLNSQGLADAASIGKTVKRLGLPIGRLLSSEFCRAFTSAQQLAIGLPVEQRKELTFTVYDETKRCDNTMTLAASMPRDAKNSIFITHTGLASSLPNCTVINQLQWGDAAVFALDAAKQISFAGFIRVKDWTDLAK